MLIHWNSEKGQGRGETHEVIEHRLRQMGRLKLADWLGKTVFHQLGKDLERSFDDPFRNLDKEEDRGRKYTPVEQLAEAGDPTEWLPIDTIFYSIVAILLVLTTGILLVISYRLFCRNLFARKRSM